MSKIIIENLSDLPDYLALILVSRTVKKGKVSGSKSKSQYAYVSTFECNGFEVDVIASKNKCSDKLLIKNANYSQNQT